MIFRGYMMEMNGSECDQIYRCLTPNQQIDFMTCRDLTTNDNNKVHKSPYIRIAYHFSQYTYICET